MALVRKLQKTYNMEPAGSHGVWSLDDFQFLPFIFGSSMINGNLKIEPRHFVIPEYIEKLKSEQMFFGCIDYITSVIREILNGKLINRIIYKIKLY